MQSVVRDVLAVVEGQREGYVEDSLVAQVDRRVERRHENIQTVVRLCRHTRQRSDVARHRRVFDFHGHRRLEEGEIRRGRILVEEELRVAHGARPAIEERGFVLVGIGRLDVVPIGPVVELLEAEREAYEP